MAGNFSIQTNYTGKNPENIVGALSDLKNLANNYQRFINMFYMAGTRGAAYTCTSNDNVILVDGTRGEPITLPNPVGMGGKQITVKDWRGISSLRNITILSSGTHLVDGTTSGTTLSTDYEAKTFVSDNKDWYTI